jgi:hypothetical protein
VAGAVFFIVGGDRAGSARADDGEESIVLVRGAREARVEGSDVAGAVDEGLDLFRRSRANTILQSEPTERFEQLARPEQLLVLQDDERWLDLFLDGDDAFSFAFDRSFGAGRGPGRADGAPHAPQPVHAGDGGLDGTSCRSCHFSGGPDGAGTATQRALLRGDGHRTTSAVVRDAPHVMGLGPIMLVAAQMTRELQTIRARAEAAAETTTVDESFPLIARGVSFGALLARPGGEVDARGVDGVSHDLVVRPFGLKGRHADLVALVDEALEVHHGVQTASRLVHAGDDEEEDPDGDGVVAPLVWRDGTVGAESSAAQAVLLAGYLAVLGVPEVHPPSSPDLLLRWAEGRALLDAVGCTLCHVEQLTFTDDVIALQSPERADGTASVALTLSLVAAQREPAARRIDFAPGSAPPGTTPVFLYSDLKRHDLGAALADDVDEPLPGDAGVVRGSEWLTRPLWGVADTAPYLHDGRAATLDEAITLHGGEAAGSRDAYLLLSVDERAALRVFLSSLSRQTTVIVE